MVPIRAMFSRCHARLREGTQPVISSRGIRRRAYNLWKQVLIYLDLPTNEIRAVVLMHIQPDWILCAG